MNPWLKLDDAEPLCGYQMGPMFSHGTVSSSMVMVHNNFLFQSEQTIK